MAQYFKNPKTGKYGFRIFYNDKNGKRRSIQKTIFKRQSDARKYAEKLENRVNETDIEKAETITFAKYFSEWMYAYKIGRYTKSTDNKYINAQKFIENYFKDTLLKNISKMDYQSFIDDYAKDHVKESIERLNGYIQSCIAEAIDEELIHRNFTRNLVITTNKKSKPADLKYLELDVASRLKEMALKDESIFNISAYEIVFALDTGARYAEIAGMTWDNIDLDNNTIYIKRTYDYKERTGFLPTKTESSVRELAISDNLKRSLKKLQLQQRKLFLRQGFDNKHKFVFMNNRHQIPSDSAANKVLRNYLKSIDTQNYKSKGLNDKEIEKKIHSKVKKNEYIGMHGLRHTHASYLFSQGLSLEYVSQRLGHSNIGITSKIYVHILKDYKEREDVKAMEVLENL